jgi:hypothetical protein
LTPTKVSEIIDEYNFDDTVILLCGTENYNNMITDTIKETFETYKW